MDCQAVQMWSLSGLVAAFLDLAIAYLLLCASAIAYLASKFLGFLGLNLPCPCEGMFFNIRSKSLCLNSLLVDFPTQKVSDVQLSVKHKFPFSDSMCPKKLDFSNGGDNCVNGILEMEGEASCSSVSDGRREMSARARKYDMKGKGVMSYRSRYRLRQHRKTGENHGKYSSVSSHDPPLHEEVLDVEPYCHSSSNKGENGYIRDVDDNKAPAKMGVKQRADTTVEMSHSPDEDMHRERSILSNENIENNPPELQSFNRDEKNRLSLLEQTLEEERIARASLYIELEKERSAAATAAEEAMAMILRLQEEKASIEMEARQYQRMTEEKSVYDDEEMSILKEILVRREMEKHFLEKEVEGYRQIALVGNEQLAGNCLVTDSNDDPVLILHQLVASTDKKVSMENKCFDRNESSVQYQDQRSCFEKRGDSNANLVQISVSNNEGSIDLQEKEIISVDNSLQLASKGPQESIKTRSLDAELNEVPKMNRVRKLESVTCNETEASDPPVCDVHIIGDGIDFCSEANVDKTEQLSGSSSSEVCEKHPVPFEALTKRVNGSTETEVDLKRTSSEIPRGLPPSGPRGSSLLSEMRRRSLSSVDSEMLKIDSEVGRLRERLKLVREEKEKLSLSVENREKENVQLKLLEDIARQIQEIRHLTVTGKAARQASLPPPNSKALSKKRRSRSVSSGLPRSSEG